MKNSKKLSKLMALAVLFGSMSCMYNAWAESTPTEVKPTELTKNDVVVAVDGFTINGTKGTGASPYGAVYGGYAAGMDQSNDVTDNILTIIGGDFTTDGGYEVCGGYTYGYGKVSNNIVTITDGIFMHSIIYGGCADLSNNVSDMSNNIVTITGGTINCDVYGGWAASGKASGNMVMISGAHTQVTGTLYGVYSNNGTADATNNAVIIAEGTYEGSSIIGGSSNGGNANNNQVVISGAAVVDNKASGADIGAGYSNAISEQTQENLVQITTTTGNVKANTLQGGNRTATKNTLIIGDTDVIATDVKKFEKYYFAIPDSAKDGDTLLNNTNSFSLSGGTLYVQPKYSETGYTVTLAKASDLSGCSEVETNLPGGNAVTGGTISQDGDYVKYSQTGITSWMNAVPGSLTNNVVEVTGDTTATVNGITQNFVAGEFPYTSWMNIYGGYSSVLYAYVMDNNVTITEGNIFGEVYGGYSSHGVAMGNRVTITGGTFAGDVHGGNDFDNGIAKDNLIVITDGMINNDVYGGCSKGYTATGNTVVITGGTFANTVEICGGHASAQGTVDTSNNTVQISAPITVSKMEGSNQTATGNTLIVDAKGVSATTVEGFKNCAFYLPKDIGTDPLMTVGGTMNVSGPVIYVVPDYSLTPDTKYTLASTDLWAGGSIGQTKYDLAPNNKMSSETPTVAVESNNLVYTMGTISEWRSVQPSSLTGNKVELVANVSGKATAIVNGTTQTRISDIVSSSWVDVYGGYSTMKGAYVANNTVTISSAEGLNSGMAHIYGGYAPNGTVENNTLEVTVAGVEVRSVDGFDNYNFTLPSTTEDDFMLSLVSAYSSDDFQGDTITVNLNGSETESIILIEDNFATSLDGVTFKVTEDGTTFVSEEDAKGCFSVTSPETGLYSLVFTNNLGVSLKPTDATDNTITITGDNAATGYTGTLPPAGKTWKHVYGGYLKSGAGNVANNKLTIQAGTISGNVFGGYIDSGTGNVTNNTVTITGGMIKGNVVAGFNGGTGTVSGNALYWQGGTIKGNRIVGNTVEISGTGATYLGEEGTIVAVKPNGTLIPVDLKGKLTVGDADTNSKLTFAGGVNIGKNAELIVKDGSDVILEGNSTLSGTVTAEKITNKDILNVDASGRLVLVAAVKGQDGILNIKSGTELVYTGSEIENTVAIEAGATMDPDAGVFKNSVTNWGTLVLEGGNLTQTVSNIGGTLKVTSPVTIGTNGEVTVDADSTLAIAAANFTTDAAIQGITSTNFTLADGAKIKLTGDTDDETYYILLAGENTAMVDLVSKVSDGLVDETGEQFTETDVKTNGDGTAVIAKVSTLNVDEMNLNSLAGIQQGMVSMQNITVDTVAAHMGLINKAKGEGKYSKEVWASYLNNKDNVDGFNMAKYDAKYNGVTVGVDFYSSEKSVAGVAVTYAKGDVNGNGVKSGIRNDGKYYGISFYDRVDLKNSALLMDLGYMNSKNETNVSTTKSVTGDAKVDSYTLGVRWEKDYQFKNSKLVPFVGVRYLRLNSKDFSNSRGLNYSTNSQNLFQPKIGVAWAGDYKMNDNGWNFKPKAEVGYLWALGNREADTALNYKGHDKGNVLYDVTDKSSYYAKLGIEFNHKKFAAGVDYSYMKGSSVRSNRWNINLSWSF